MVNKKRINTLIFALHNVVMFGSGDFGSNQYYAYDSIVGQDKSAINLEYYGSLLLVIEDGILVSNSLPYTILVCYIKIAE